MNFTKFKFGDAIQEGLEMMGFEKATPIQEKAIPIIQKGKDLIACAQTGTGKTAAFVLPILDKLTRVKQTNKVKVIIVAPTRELAQQIDMQIEGFSYFTNSSSYPVYGGGTGSEFENQKQALIQGTDIIICTPGRLMAHLRFNYFDTSGVEHFILDEADRMLDMGFYDDVMVIANRLPKIRQNLLFSATMPPKIRTLANNLLTEPESISLAISKPAAGITQSAYMVDDHQKVKLVREILRERGNNLSHVLIFASSIKSVKKIKETLNTANMRASDMHSGLDQQQREDTIREFKNKKIRILVATNILSRGIDIKEIGLVINYEVPHDAEDYVHRIGRTARADRTGEAITFINQKDVSNFLEIEKLIKKKVPRLTLPKSLGTTLDYNTVSRNKNKKHYFKKSPNKPNVPR
jgi:superfamily II DNA/RNA helicase